MAPSSTSLNPQTLKVSDRSAFFAGLHKKAQLPRSLMDGTQGMRAGGEKYLPRFPNEDEEAWDARLAQSFLFNAYRIAHEAMVGKAFSHPIVLRDDVPSSFREWAENIDRSGSHLDIFAQHVFADSLHPGRGYILVEFPERPVDLPARPSREQEKAADLRPYFVYLSADEDMLSIDEEVRNGETVTTRIRFRRVVSEEDGWGQRNVERFHVWKLVRGEDDRGREVEFVERTIYRKEDEEEVVDAGPTTIIGFQGRPLARIPLAEFIASKEGPFLEDLGWKNLEHWQSASDQRNVLHVARVIAMVLTGVDKEKWESGDHQMGFGHGSLYFLPENATMEHLLYEGDVSIGERDLARIEENMVTLSLEPLLNKPGNPTATSKALDQARANSRLLAAVRKFADALEMAMEFAAVDYFGEETGGSVAMNENFGLSLYQDEELRTLRELRLPDQKGQKPQISHQTLVQEMKYRGILRDDVDAAEEVRRILRESAAIGGARAEGGGEDGESEGEEEEEAEEEEVEESEEAAA